MSRALYFAYGSNLDAEQMRERCPGSLPAFRARLRDHRLDFTHFSSRWQGGTADVVPHAGSTVWGLVYELPAEELDLLDHFEGGYDRLQLEVQDDAERSHVVTSYAVREKQRFAPSDAYLQKMLRWSRRWEFPPDYLRLLGCARS